MDETAEQLELALSHMYDAFDLKHITLDNVGGLVAFFSKYDVPQGIAACDAFLSATAVLDTANLPGWIVLADQRKLTCFLEKCVKHAAEHMSEMEKPAAWMELLLPATLAQLVSQLVSHIELL